MAARKPWRELSPAYRRRMEKAGLNARNWGTKRGDTLRQAARGHGKTPEHPARAKKDPERYREYMQAKQDFMRQVIARKERVFGDRIKYSPRRSVENVNRNPRTERPPRRDYMKRFLAMRERDLDEIDWSDTEWSFLFYH